MCVEQREKIANEVHWCQQYAAINHIALQRLVEHYDRCAESKAGAKFLQVRLYKIFSLVLPSTPAFSGLPLSPPET